MQLLHAVDPARSKSLRFSGFDDVRNLVRELVEDQLDLHASQIGPDAEVCAVATEAQVRVRISKDVEFERLVEGGIVEVRRAVEQACALAFPDGHVADITAPLPFVDHTSPFREIVLMTSWRLRELGDRDARE